mmetsp:Transcript_3819/g.10024  ORF Transcript_3819/g.10024 Transcript_3819/m.10024 type:complete len:577 (-) Transcript_3819:175-1905(-)
MSEDVERKNQSKMTSEKKASIPVVTGVDNRNSNEVDEEGIETLAGESVEVSSDNPSFSIFPAFERSNSFIRRRVNKRKGQENLVEKVEETLPEKNKTGPVDLDEVDEEESMIHRYSNQGSYDILSSSKSAFGKFRSYRRDQLIREIDSANRRGSEGHNDVLKTLRNARILVYIIDAKVSVTLTEVVDGIRRIVDHICRDPEYQDHPRNQKCLLYRDYDGRLFNLVLTSEYSYVDAIWRGYFDSFSVVQAAALLMFLTRFLGCAFELETIDKFRQVTLVVILGLVFTEEISFSWTNVALLVRGYPSISAYALTSNVVGTDWLRKLLILIFIISSATTDENFQKVCTLGGIFLTCLVLLANLGSRSWKYLKWRSFRGLPCLGNNDTVADPFLAYLVAIFTGICFPFMGHSLVEAGGVAAIEAVIRIALVVAILFILSDYDAFQRLLVLGSETCNQDYVNFIVGAWWGISLIASLTLLFCRGERSDEKFDPHKRDFTFPNDEEPLLEEETRSPTGYKVPHLPLFPVNPTYAHKGLRSCCSSNKLWIEYTLSLLVAVAGGGFICYLGTTKLDDEFLANAS